MFFEYNEIKKMLCKDLYNYFEDMINNFGYRKPPFEMQPISVYLLSSTYVMFCGALENKLKTLRFFFALINLEARREFFEKNSKSIYDDETFKKIYNFIKKIDADNNINFIENNEGIDSILEYLYNKYKDSIVDKIKNSLDNTELVNCCKLEFNIFYDFFNSSQSKETLKKIYQEIWSARHRIAHNLDFLYDNQLNLMRQANNNIKSNYFIRLGILECIDQCIIDSMEKVLNSRVYL